LFIFAIAGDMYKQPFLVEKYCFWGWNRRNRQVS